MFLLKFNIKYGNRRKAHWENMVNLKTLRFENSIFFLQEQKSISLSEEQKNKKISKNKNQHQTNWETVL